MDINGNITQYLEYLLNIAIVILPTLAVLAIAHPLGGRAARVFVSIWNFGRQFFDEKNDPAIVRLADLTGRPPIEVSQLILSNMDSVAGILKSEIDKLEAKPKV